MTAQLASETEVLKKFDLTPVVSNGPLEYLQVELVDLLSYAKKNDEYSYILTLINVFSRYVWAVFLIDKEGSMIHTELVNIFKNFGSPTKIQADNGSEFITTDDITLANDIIPADDITLAADITPADTDITPADITLADITPANITSADIIPADITPDIISIDMIFAPQDNWASCNAGKTCS
ncbi:5595_t:CDS:2 [Gigaspora rosea]|nr:5595_t:CDS:2 [Gigaspora rosea]